MRDIILSIIYFVISAVVMIIDLFTAHLCFAQRKKSSKYLAHTAIGAALVQFTYLFSVIFTNYFWASLFASFYFVSVSFTIVSIYLFIRTYTTNKYTKIHNFYYKAIMVIFVIDALILLINPFYEICMKYEDNGHIIAKYTYHMQPLYMGHLSFAYLIMLTVIIALIINAYKTPKVYRKKYTYSIYTIIFVVLLNAIFLFYPELFGTNALDYSIWGYSLSCLVIYWNCFRYPQEGMKSFYHSWVVENVNQGVILFNYEDKLIITNNKIKSMFPDVELHDDLSIEEFAEQIKLDLRTDRQSENYSFQFYVEKENQVMPIRFDHHCLRDENGSILGQLLTFTNESGEVDLLTSFYSWNNFKRSYKEQPERFVAPFTVIVCDINGLGEINSTLGRSVGDRAIAILSKLMRKYLTGENYFLRGQEASLICLNFTMSDEEINKQLELLSSELANETSLPCIISIQSAVSKVKTSDEDILEAITQAFKGLNNKKLLDASSQHSELVRSLIRTLEECDNDTEAHVRRTQLMGQELGKRLGLSDVQLSDLALLCILHDIGKIGIPLEILNKPGKLSPPEWRMMKTHTEKGYQIARSSKELSEIADMILHHHECWNGSGYPDGLSKESIPLLSRIISVVDAYDAMVNDRVYRPALSISDAKKELRRCAGTQFDPGIVNEFINMLPEIKDSEESSVNISVLSQQATETANTIPENQAAQINVHPVKYSRYILDDEMHIIRVDSEFERLTGYSQEEVLSLKLTQSDLLPEEDTTQYIRLATEQLAQSDCAYFEHRIKRKDGSIFYVFCFGKMYYDSADKAERSEIIIVDSAETYAIKLMLNEEQDKAKLRLEKWEDKYRCDSLTGLLNHEAFKNDIEMQLINDDLKVMLLMMDVDKFKEYNDTFGHMAGDEFLIRLSQSLTNTLRKDDLACRMGGDEFAAALFYNKDTSDSQMIDRAQQIFDKISLHLSSEKGGTTLSMGVAISSMENNSFNKLYENADIALYDAKESGRSRMVAPNT